jgi:hypothetical protein
LHNYLIKINYYQVKKNGDSTISRFIPHFDQLADYQ